MTETQSHKSEIAPSDKFAKLKIIFADYAELLTAYELLVLTFIFMRTYFWGKKREFIIFRHFIDGIPGTIAGLPLSENSIKRAIRGLVDKGLLIKETEKFGCYFTIVDKWNVVMLKSPKPKNKSKKGLSEPKKRGASQAYRGGLTGLHNYEHKNNSENTESESKLSHPLSAKKKVQEDYSLDEAIERAKVKSAASSKKKKERAARRENVADLELLWKDRLRKNYKEIAFAGWTKKEFGQVKTMRDAFKETDNKALWPFLEFVVDNWHRIAKLRFSWMKGVEVPEYPAIDFVMGFKKHFLLAFHDTEFFEHQVSFSSEEREIRKLKRQGFTQEQAEAEIKGRVEKLKSVAPLIDKNAELEKAAIHSQRDAERLEKENRLLKAKLGAQDAAIEKLNRGSKEIDDLKKKPEKKKPERDADGYIIFKG